jgi:hypothetical protein
MSDCSKTTSLQTVFPTSIRPVETRIMHRACLAALLAGIIGLVTGSQAVGYQVCKPALAITDVKFSEWMLPTMERRWSAVVSVDASRCSANSAGHFEVGFERLIENGTDTEFSEEFVWMSPSVKVAIDFWANEAVGKYWINKVSVCPCAK